MSASIPTRGDYILLNFNPQAGHEQSGRRIALVLSPSAFNEATGFVVVCPITNQKKGYPFEVSLPEEGVLLPQEGLPITGVILTDQVKSLDWKARNLKILKKYTLEDPQIQELDEIIEDCLAKIATYLT